MPVSPTKVTVRLIQNGSAVSPAVTNVPHQDLESNVDNILAYLKAAMTGYFDQDLTTTTGLTFGYRSGMVRTNNVVTVIAAGTLAIPSSSVRYIEADSSGIYATTTAFTPGRIPLWQVTTNASAIIDVQDRRTPLISVKASDLRFEPTTNIQSTTIQTAIEEAHSEASNTGIAFSVVFGS